MIDFFWSLDIPFSDLIVDCIDSVDYFKVLSPAGDG